MSKKSKWIIPIRLKIVALVAGALGLSLLSYLYVGTSLIVDDKVSYIYDYNQTRVHAEADLVEGRIQRAISLGKMISRLMSASSQLNSSAASALVEQVYDQNRGTSGVPALLVLRPQGGDAFRLEARLGPKSTEAQAALAELGWTPKEFERSEILVGAVRPGGEIPIGVRALDSSRKPIALLVFVKPNSELIPEKRNVQMHLLDPFGGTILSKSGLASVIPEETVAQFSQALSREGFESGAREWTLNGKPYMVGYQRILDRQLTIVGFIPKSVALSAATSLRHRSIALGAGILLVAIGLALVFVRTLTTRLRQMWHATKKVSEGDFSFRVDPGNSRDEISGLADSFNAMADRIDQLMEQTANKARIEKELETAQTVQGLFFPEKDFEHFNLNLSGKFLPATECSGDWWFYKQVGDYLVVVTGDVTGHGVSAALVTAAAHGAFSIIGSHLEDNPHETPNIISMMRYFNSAVYSASKGQSTMTFIASIIDLRTGTMMIANASHRIPYLYKAVSKNPMKCFRPLLDGQCASLGASPAFNVSPGVYQLEPGDIIVWYTDGILESPNADGKVMTKTAFFRMLAKIYEANSQDSKSICDHVMKEALKYMGKAAKKRPDDITIVVGTVSKAAKFLAKAS